jgi:hypothetical protein
VARPLVLGADMQLMVEDGAIAPSIREISDMGTAPCRRTAPVGAEDLLEEGPVRRASVESDVHLGVDHRVQPTA